MANYFRATHSLWGPRLSLNSGEFRPELLSSLDRFLVTIDNFDRGTDRTDFPMVHPHDAVTEQEMCIRDSLYAEARLLDEVRYRDWLGMLTADAVYWMPCNGDGVDPTREVTLVYDNFARLSDRVDRLTSGVAHAQSPPSKTKRLISNVQIDRAEEDAATVLSGFILYELRRGKERIFAGRYEHRLSLIHI